MEISINEKRNPILKSLSLILNFLEKTNQESRAKIQIYLYNDKKIPFKSNPFAKIPNIKIFK